MKKTNWLEPIYDRAKSFYKKAYVVIDYDEQTVGLISYGVKVAEIVPSKEGGRLVLFNGFYEFINHNFGGEFVDCRNYLDSVTTRRHINEFAMQNGFSHMTKKEMLGLASQSL